MTHASEHESEPIAGLPGQLPDGEHILWQGQPDARALARDVFKLHWVAGYFVFLSGLRLCVEGTRTLALSLGVSLACLGVLALLAKLHARSTMYTITTRRVVMRIGVALPVTWNLPFKRLASAQLGLRKHGKGDIVLSLAPPDRVSFLQFWPHTEPGRIRNAQPCLRALPEPQRVASVLAEAVQQSAAFRVEAAAPHHQRAHTATDRSIAPPEPQQPAAEAAPAISSIDATSIDATAHAASQRGARNAPRHEHAQTVPRPLLWGACALMFGSITLAAVSGKPGSSAQRASQVIELRFEDRQDGALAVLDGSTERELVVLAPGSNNFIRGVLRGMFRVRKLEALGRDVPFRLAADASGKLTLEDRELGRRVELDSFGPDNAAAFRDLLALAVRDAMRTQARALTGGQHGDYPRP